MLIEHIEALRKQPKHIRRQAAQFYTILVVAAIAVLYLFVQYFVPLLLPDETEPAIQAPYAEAQE
ncbi:hypothetical protein KGO06_00010 [Patescibacteria group bacterium]|nr:hypothetical protein [Patescibacteria group bacterium]